MFDECLEGTVEEKPVVFAPPVRELVLFLVATKADPLLICFARNLYALRGYAAAMAFVLRWGNGCDD